MDPTEHLYLITCSRDVSLDEDFNATNLVKVLPGFWIVQSRRTASEITARLTPLLNGNGVLIVAAIQDSASWCFLPPNGMLDAQVRQILGT
jgi:hypothetical protein